MFASGLAADKRETARQDIMQIKGLKIFMIGWSGEISRIRVRFGIRTKLLQTTRENRQNFFNTCEKRAQVVGEPHRVTYE